MRKQPAALFAAALALGASTVTLAPPANADLTTRCVGEAGEVTVPGDLVVPRGQSCVLTGTTVTGDVRVAPDADLIAQDLQVGGDVVGRDNAFVEATDSTVGQRVVLRGAYGGYFDGSSLGAGVRNRPGADGETGGFVYAISTDISGSLRSRAGQLYLESADITGAVRSVGSYASDMYESFVDGPVVVRDNQLGSVVCATAVQGKGVFDGNGELVQLGSDGPFADCAKPSYWGSNVAVTDTSGDVYVDNNIVNANLTLRRNDPVARLGSNNLVRGEVRGEFESWDGTAPQASPQRSLRGAPDRKHRLQHKVEQRRAAATKHADRDGNAHIGR